ncbi:MAG: hypothetical protein K2K11_01400, partial [Bacteroidales bacterium]|nr:hypothetical protein [Bacteroidales bacterium]
SSFTQAISRWPVLVSSISHSVNELFRLHRTPSREKRFRQSSVSENRFSETGGQRYNKFFNLQIAL